MAKDKKQKKKSKAPSAGKMAVMLLLMVVILTFLIGYSLIFLLAGMLPSLVAYITDRTPNRFNVKTVGCMNFAGVAPYLSLLIQQGNQPGVVQSMLSDANVWMVMYGSAALGWVIVWLAPLSVKHILLMFAHSRKEALAIRQDELIDEWGEEVKGITTAPQD